MPAYDSFTIEHDGKFYAVEVHDDPHMGAPWEEHDGHGEVSEWTSRAKLPGELVLISDGTKRRYYDFAGTVKTAKADGWGPGKPHEAARADFEFLRDWCQDRWHWCGVVVRAADACCGASASLWGIESNAGDYLREVALELIDELE